MDKLHSFFVALEYLNVCDFNAKSGPLRYMAELEEWRHENKGLALLLAVDSLIRKKIHRLNHDQRKLYPTFSSALLEVLTHHKQLWNDARSSAELDKFKQAGQLTDPVTPIRGVKRTVPEDDSPGAPSPDKKSRNQKRRARQKALLEKAKQSVEVKKTAVRPDKTARDARVPAAEWSKITAFKYGGKKRCPFFNCSLGCRFGDSCKNAHQCVECGQAHPWHGNHWVQSSVQTGEEDPTPAGSLGSPSIRMNEDSGIQDLTSSVGGRTTWKSWKDVPQDPRLVASLGPWFLEVFSGTARLTTALRSMGVSCLPPIDIMPSEMVPEPSDVLDAAFWDFIMQLIMLGAIFFMHFGTPCNTFSSARKDDGGPPPLRSLEFPEGLPDLDLDLFSVTFLGNLFVDRTAEACCALCLMGMDFSVENPLFSLIWSTPALVRVAEQCRTMNIDFDQCMWGAPSVKPTRLMVTAAQFRALEVRCDRSHPHQKLKGKVWSAFFGRRVFRTKLAQEYPFRMCEVMAQCIADLVRSPFDHLASTFALVGPKADRKRPLGQSVQWKDHRQAASALKAAASGYQLKRGALKTLLHVETEPGEAIAWSLQIPHPFSEMNQLDSDVAQAIQQVTADPAGVIRTRKALLHHWSAQALQCLHHTDQELRQIPDGPLRRLLRGVPDGEPARLGATCNIKLYQMLLKEAHSVDLELPHLLMTGFPIVGEISRSGRWPPFDRQQDLVSVEELCNRAWEMRRKIVKRVQGVPVTTNLTKIWEATMEDAQDGSCLGPFFGEEEVTEVVQQTDWVPTQRFEVVQKNKVRGCDSATTNLVNRATVITEKLQLPSTDSNVAALRCLRSKSPWSKLAGWVLDEKKAYRQVAISPAHRKFSVICLKDPISSRVAFFVMVGHSFGLVSAVYNYNRRSAAINEILVRVFGLVAFSFYDDKYGFETIETVASAHQVAQSVHWWLGAAFDQKKLQLTRQPVVLGVTYNLVEMVLEIKEDRKKELIEEMEAFIKNDLLDPGSAGKLKGKLMFGASQLWGKVGRAFLRVISERQYARHPPDGAFSLGVPLKRALEQWMFLVSEGPPRPIDLKRSKFSDAVLFTDGFSPDPRSQEKLPDRIGAVIIDRRLSEPIQFTAAVPIGVKNQWLDRKTQIVPVEMLGPIVAISTFTDRLFFCDVLLFVDSEAVEAALVKGYSGKSDLCDLIKIFWDLVFKLRMRIFIDRVATDANPADWPSRNDLETGSAAGWKSVRPIWPECINPSSVG